MTNRPLQVVHFSRRPPPGAFSIERVFADVRAAMPENIQVMECMNAHLSRGVLPRLRDAWRARRHAAAVNHVTGDVHYLTYFLPSERTLLTVHDTVMIERAKGVKRWLLWFLWLWLPARRCRWISAISDESKRRILRLVPIDPERIVVIPDPVSPNFAPTPLPPRSGPFRLLHIGTKPNKNLERVIEALAGLEIELTVIGRMTKTQAALFEWYNVAYRNLTDLSDDDLRAEYGRAEALIFVSLDEGFGLPIIEAQASGRPVITAARPPMDEIAGGAALLVDPEDTTAICSAVQRLAEDPELSADLAERGVDNARRFAATTVAAAYVELYARIDYEARASQRSL